MPEGKEPAIHGSTGVTQEFINLQICEKFGGIDPFNFLGVKKPQQKIKVKLPPDFLQDNGIEKEIEITIDSPSEWKTDQGRALKTLLYAYHQLLAKEEKRVYDEMDKKSNGDKDNSFVQTPQRGRRG